MALKATIFKAELTVSDTDRQHYATHALTLARHPSETDERLMVRLLAFALHADEALHFTKGLSTEDEPDLWQKSLTGDIALWVDVGLPDEKRIRKACGRASQVVIYAYGGSKAELWWAGVREALARFDKLTVYNLPREATAQLAAMAERSMQLSCSIGDGSAWFSDASHHVCVEPVTWMAPGHTPG